jgi:hypothetical protein
VPRAGPICRLPQDQVREKLSRAKMELLLAGIDVILGR